MEQFLKWKMSWARLLDGLLGVLSYGHIYTNFAINCARELTRYRSKHNIGR